MNQVAVVETDAVVASMSRARLALAEAKTIQQTKRIVDAAAAAEIYAKRQKLGEEASELALSIKVEALRKLGEMLKSSPRASGVKKSGSILGGAKLELPRNDAPTLGDLGLTKKESAVAQKLAALSDDEFQQVRDGHVTVSKAIAAVHATKVESVAAAAPAVAKVEDRPEPSHPPQAASQPDPANDEAPTLAELVDELQAENTRLTAEIKALESDDQKAETLKWHRLYEHAMRSTADAQRQAAAHQKDAKRLGKQVRECCAILGLQDPRQLVPTVKQLAARREVA